LGGACSRAAVIPVPPTKPPPGGGFGYRPTRKEKEQRFKEYEEILRLRHEETEEIPLLVAAIWVTIWRD
jgi:hypothetical protein